MKIFYDILHFSVVRWRTVRHAVVLFTVDVSFNLLYVVTVLVDVLVNSSSK